MQPLSMITFQVVDLAMALRPEALLPGIANLEQQLRHRLQADGWAHPFRQSRPMWHILLRSYTPWSM